MTTHFSGRRSAHHLALVLAAFTAAFAAAPAAHAQAAPAPAPATGTRTAPGEYRLGVGDVVRITVYQNVDLTLEARISEAGAISFPLLGSVKLGGLSVTEAEKRIADGLRTGNFVKQPQVSLLVTQVRGNQVSVLGLVNRPGRFPIETADLRLSDLLATAGGLSAGSSDIVTLVGTRGGQPFRTEIDLPQVFAAQRPSEDLLVQNGDVIWVGRAPTIYIYGEVQRPGPMRLERGMTLMQALATGGGLTLRGTEKGIQVRRKGTDGKTQTVPTAMDEGLRDGDVVYVRESLF